MIRGNTSPTPSSDALPKVELHKILLQKSASNPEGPPLVLILIFSSKSAFTPSKAHATSWYHLMILHRGAFDVKFLSRRLKAAKLHC